MADLCPNVYLDTSSSNSWTKYLTASFKENKPWDKIPIPKLHDFKPQQPKRIALKNGIVLFYNAADDNLMYRTAIAVFDRKDPRKLIWRSEQPVFSPEKPWEKVGQVPNVVFVEGIVRQSGRYWLYYGAADKYIGVAEVPVIP